MEGENGFKVYLAFRRRVSSELYFASSPGVLVTVSTHLVTPTAVLKLNSLFLFPLDERDATSGFRVLVNHLASFFFFHLPLSCYSFGLLNWPPYIPNLGLRSSGSLTSIRYFLQQAAWSWPTFFIPPFNGQFWGLFIQTQKETSYFSPLSGRPRDNCVIAILRS